MEEAVTVSGSVCGVVSFPEPRACDTFLLQNILYIQAQKFLSCNRTPEHKLCDCASALHFLSIMTEEEASAALGIVWE